MSRPERLRKLEEQLLSIADLDATEQVLSELSALGVRATANNGVVSYVSREDSARELRATVESKLASLAPVLRRVLLVEIRQHALTPPRGGSGFRSSAETLSQAPADVRNFNG